MSGNPGKRHDQTGVVDLTNCDREPIHLLGRVQSFGFLLGTSLDWTVTYASTNTPAFLDIEAEDCLAKPLVDIVGSQGLHAIRNRLQFLRGQSGIERVRNIPVGAEEKLFDCLLHISEDTFVLEFEPSRTASQSDEDITQVRAFMARLTNSQSLGSFFTDTARFMRLLTGFSRVMVYKFLHDDSGEVIAEVKTPNLESFLGLRYPASDIPKQARALYLKNPIRLICDVSDAGHEIIAINKPENSTLDLSLSTLRSVSSIHLEYLKNMDVAASMSVSIIVNGKLWGLIACHSTAPVLLDQAKRSAIDLFGQMFSLLLSGKLAAEETARDDEVTRLTEKLSSAFDPSKTPIDSLTDPLGQFMELLQADGFGLWIDGSVKLIGETPCQDAFARLIETLNSNAQPIYHSHQLHDLLGAQPGSAAGILALSISRSPSDYIVFFRQEIEQKVRWAGNPNKPVNHGPLGDRLTPRKSFAVWTETVKGTSSPWTASDIRVANQLRLALLEIVLRFTDEAARERLAAHEKQELLIAELNHRVRNILGLVKGIITQSQSAQLSTAEYVSMLDSRIQALARAHDQITRKNWAAASFKDLVRTETESYLLHKGDRVFIEGDDVLLHPTAFSTVALVMHELMTNAAKYGALVDQNGKVYLKLSLEPSGGLTVNWEERDGPSVSVPDRRGFGSTIIERSIPFELAGRASLDYDQKGVRATFEIPAPYVVRADNTEVREAANKPAEPADIVEAPETVVIVEDNMLIAMEAEDLFRSIGSKHVQIASNLQNAHHLIFDTMPDFVLLDVNLGHQNSLDLAMDLLTKNIRFGFATGYGESTVFSDALRSIPRMSKPYERDSLVRLLKTLGF